MQETLLVFIKRAKYSMKAKVCLMFINVFWAFEESELFFVFVVNSDVS